VFDGSMLTLYVDGAVISQVTATAPGSTPGIPVKMGPHYSNPGAYGVINALLDDVRIYDRALGTNDIAQLYNGTATTTGDTTPPTIALTSPTNGSTVTGTVTIAAVASDNVGVTKAQFYRDGAVLLGTATTAPFNLSWNTATTTDGSHALAAKAYDAAGNATTSTTSTVTVSNAVAASGQLQWAQAGSTGPIYGQGRTLGV